MEGNDLAGPDLFGKLRSGEAKAAAGGRLETAATSREMGVVGRKEELLSFFPSPQT